MNKPLLKKILKIASNVLLYTFIAFCAALVIFSFSFKKSSNDALTIFGHQIRIVQSDSMEPNIPVKSVVFIETVPEDEQKAEKWFEKLEIGDVLTFRYVYNGQVTITHRIVDIEDKPTGERIITLEGDNKSASTDLLQQTLDTSEHFTSFNYTIGKVTGHSYVLGLLLYAMNTPVGTFCIVVVPCLIIIVVEIVRIVNALSEDKRKKDKEDKAKKDAEIELLKQQLAALQGGNDPTQPAEENVAVEETTPIEKNVAVEETPPAESSSPAEQPLIAETQETKKEANNHE